MQTLKSKSERSMVIGTTTSQSLKHLHHFLMTKMRLNDIYTTTNSLSELIAPSEFKSYEELKEKLDRVLGLSGGATSTSTAESVAEDLDEVPWSNVNTESVADEPVISSVIPHQKVSRMVVMRWITSRDLLPSSKFSDIGEEDI